MDFPASLLLATILFSFPPTNDILRNFCSAYATHISSHLLAYNRWTSQNCFGRVTYRQDPGRDVRRHYRVATQIFAPSGGFSWYVFLWSPALRIIIPDHQESPALRYFLIFPLYRRSLGWGFIGGGTQGGRYPQCPS